MEVFSGEVKNELNYAVKEIVQRTGIIDAHCDTVHYFEDAKEDYSFHLKNSKAHLDLPRMRSGGIKAQFFALYIEPEYKPYGALKRCLQLLDSFFRTVEPLSEYIQTVYDSKGIEKTKNEGKIAAMLSIEGGEVLEGDTAVLRMLFRLGIRSIGLTWNQRNQLADGIEEKGTSGGLTTFGKKVVQEMNNLGMIVDLSHISVKGFNDVLKVSSSPVIVSHANTYAVCAHPRNLKNEQLKELGNHGGVVGLTVCPYFIDFQNPNFEILLDHFVHAVDIAGIDHVGIGSDFDGITNVLPGFKDVSFLPELVKGLFGRGFKEEEVEKIIYKNFFRVISEICG